MHATAGRSRTGPGHEGRVHVNVLGSCSHRTKLTSCMPLSVTCVGVQCPGPDCQTLCGPGGGGGGGRDLPQVPHMPQIP
jgi:hypothetical protein